MFASVNDSVPVPTGVATTAAGSNGIVENGGPRVEYNVPAYVPSAILFAVIASHVAPRRRLPPNVRHAYTLPYDSWANRIATLRFVQDIPLGPRDPSFAEVSRTAASLDSLRSRPMLICWGERDFVFDRHFLAEWMRRFPEAEVHRFPDAGHYLLEDAADRVVPIVHSFLTENFAEALR